MAPQAFPSRVASPPQPLPAWRSGRPAGIPPRLWPNLSGETQMQIARMVAELMRRMQAIEGAPVRETARADRREAR
jgi:hypothetical protein